MSMIILHIWFDMLLLGRWMHMNMWVFESLDWSLEVQVAKHRFQPWDLLFRPVEKHHCYMAYGAGTVVHSAPLRTPLIWPNPSESYIHSIRFLGNNRALGAFAMWYAVRIAYCRDRFIRTFQWQKYVNNAAPLLPCLVSSHRYGPENTLYNLASRLCKLKGC